MTTAKTEDNLVPGLDSSEKLKAWLHAKGIHFIVFDAQKFVDALPLEDIETFQQLVKVYGEHCDAEGFDATDDEWSLRATTPRGQLTKAAPGEALDAALAALGQARGYVSGDAELIAEIDRLLG